MGRYLAIGLVHRISVSLEDMRKHDVSSEEIRHQITQDYSIDLDLYDVDGEEATNKTMEFYLPVLTFEKGLIPFLEAFYPVVCQRREHDEYQTVLNLLRTTPTESWLELANKKAYSVFQKDETNPHFLTLSKPFQPGVRIRFARIILYMGYGKVITEGIDDFTQLFSHFMRETFRDHPIAGAVQVYLTD